MIFKSTRTCTTVDLTSSTKARTTSSTASATITALSTALITAALKSARFLAPAKAMIACLLHQVFEPHGRLHEIHKATKLSFFHPCPSRSGNIALSSLVCRNMKEGAFLSFPSFQIRTKFFCVYVCVFSFFSAKSI